MNGHQDPDQDGVERAWELAELIAAEAVQASPDWGKIAAWATELASAALELATPRRQG